MEKSVPGHELLTLRSEPLTWEFSSQSHGGEGSEEVMMAWRSPWGVLIGSSGRYLCLISAAGSVQGGEGSIGLEPFLGEHLMRSWELLEKCLRISVRQRQFTLWVIKLSPCNSQIHLISPLFMAHPKLPSTNLRAREWQWQCFPSVRTPGTSFSFCCHSDSENLWLWHSYWLNTSHITCQLPPSTNSAGWEVGCDILGSSCKLSALLGNPLTWFLMVATDTEPSSCVTWDRLLNMSLLHP